MHDYVLTVLVTAAVTYVLTPLVRRLAVRAGAMHEARDRDVHMVPIPQWGGLAMFGGLAVGLLVADQIPVLRGDAYSGTGMLSGLLLAGGLLVVIGMVDDRFGLSALTKGAGQVAAGAILVATGTQLDWVPMPGGGTFSFTSDQATLVTILMVVATINAVNFIDGLDGLAAGIVAIAAVSFFWYYYSMTSIVHISALAAPALASALLIGMCLGFLPHNFYPARVFMGDTGAMLLGLLLAYAPIASINSLVPGDLTSQVNRYPEVMPLLLPAALLVIPYADLLLAVVRRTRAGTSPFSADRKHLHHRLLDIGHSQRASVLIMYLWAALFSGSIVWLSTTKTNRPGAPNHHGEPLAVFVAITVAAVVALLLMSMPRLRVWEHRGTRTPIARPAGSPEPELADSLVPVAAPAAVAASDGGVPATTPNGTSAGAQPDGSTPELVLGPSRPVRSVVGTVPPGVDATGPHHRPPTSAQSAVPDPERMPGRLATDVAHSPRREWADTAPLSSVHDGDHRGHLDRPGS